MLLPGQQTCLCRPATAPIPAPDTHPGRGPQSVWSGPCPRLRFRFTPFTTFASPQFPRCITIPSHHGAFARASPSGLDFPDPYALLILPPSSPLVKLQHRFFRGPSLTRETGSRASLTSLHSTTRFSAGLVACKRTCVCDSCLVSLHRTLRQQRGDRGFSVRHSLLAPSSVPSVLWVLNIYRLLCKQRWELSCPPHHGDMIQTANRHPRN